ncbi:unnamed protein product, partial [Prorocentrum cordatum]
DGPESREPPAGWWGRLLGGRGRQPSPGPGARAAAVAEAERSLDLAGGLDAASARGRWARSSRGPPPPGAEAGPVPPQEERSKIIQ